MPTPPQIDIPERDHYREFVDVILAGGKEKCSASFDYAGPLTESVLIGNVAAHFTGETLEFDAKSLSFPRKREANQYLTRSYRSGFGMKGVGVSSSRSLRGCPLNSGGVTFLRLLVSEQELQEVRRFFCLF